MIRKFLPCRVLLSPDADDPTGGAVDPAENADAVEPKEKPPAKPKKAKPSKDIVSGGDDESVVKLKNEVREKQKKLDLLNTRIAELEEATDRQIEREREVENEGNAFLDKFRNEVAEDFGKLGI